MRMRMEKCVTFNHLVIFDDGKTTVVTQGCALAEVNEVDGEAVVRTIQIKDSDQMRGWLQPAQCRILFLFGSTNRAGLFPRWISILKRENLA